MSFFFTVTLVISLNYCSCSGIVTGVKEQDNAIVNPPANVGGKSLSNDDIKTDIEKDGSYQSLLAEADRLPHEFQSSGDEWSGNNKSTSIELQKGLSRVKRCGGGDDDDDDDGDTNRSRRSRRARRRRARRARARRSRKAAKRARKSSTTTTVTRQIIQDGQVVSSTVEQNGQPTVITSNGQQGIAQVQQPVVVHQNPSVATVQPVNQPNQGLQPSNLQATPQLAQQPQDAPQQVAANQQAPVQQPVANPAAVSTSFSAQGSVKV